MALLERIMQMQGQGLSDSQINMQLQNEGLSPKDVNDALNQAKVKTAVSLQDQDTQQVQQETPTPPVQGQPEELPPLTSPIQQVPGQFPPEESPANNLPVQPPVPGQPEQTYAPEGQGQYPPQEQAPQQYPPQDGQEQSQDYYSQTPQSYSGEEDYYNQSGYMSTETVSEIAEQVISEKTGELNEKLNTLATSESLLQDNVKNIDERLKRIEASIDKLQQAVIGKIGEFGETGALIHKDLENLHGTVSNLMNPLADNLNEMKNQKK